MRWAGAYRQGIPPKDFTPPLSSPALPLLSFYSALHSSFPPTGNPLLTYPESFPPFPALTQLLPSSAMEALPAGWRSPDRPSPKAWLGPTSGLSCLVSAWFSFQPCLQGGAGQTLHSLIITTFRTGTEVHTIFVKWSREFPDIFMLEVDFYNGLGCHLAFLEENT